MAIDDAYTVSLLHFDGADASTSIIDESGKTFTAAADAQLDTAQTKFGASSCLFDGTGDYVYSSASADFRLDAGSNSNAWTVDLWIRFSTSTSARRGIITGYVDNQNYWSVVYDPFLSGFRYEQRVSNSTVVSMDKTWSPSINNWYHLALVKNGTSGYMAFINGSQIGTTHTDVDVMSSSNASLRVGHSNEAGVGDIYMNGWIDEVRVSKGVARWTANFTPPTSQYSPAFVGGHTYWFD